MFVFICFFSQATSGKGKLLDSCLALQATLVRYTGFTKLKETSASQSKSLSFLQTSQLQQDQATAYNLYSEFILRLCLWLYMNAKACPIAPDPKSMASLWNGEVICVADVARSEVFDNYLGLEKLKNGCVLQTKYEAYFIPQCLQNK